MRKLLFAGLLVMAGCSQFAGNHGATGAAADSSVGTRPNAGATANGSTQSASILEQRIKQNSANGASSGGGNTKY